MTVSIAVEKAVDHSVKFDYVRMVFPLEKVAAGNARGADVEFAENLQMFPESEAQGLSVLSVVDLVSQLVEFGNSGRCLWEHGGQ